MLTRNIALDAKIQDQVNSYGMLVDQEATKENKLKRLEELFRIEGSELDFPICQKYRKIYADLLAGADSAA